MLMMQKMEEEPVGKEHSRVSFASLNILSKTASLFPSHPWSWSHVVTVEGGARPAITRIKEGQAEGSHSRAADGKDD